MTNLALNATRVARHSCRFFLNLCAWCDAELGAAGGSLRRCSCDAQEALLLAARQRVLSLGALAPEADTGSTSRRRGSARTRRRVERPRRDVTRHDLVAAS